MVFFSVKSAYHLAKEMEDRFKAESSKGMYRSEVWKMIWKLNVPSVVKNFLWPAYHDILPMRENLMKQKVVTNPMRPVCGLEVETTIHILWTCPSVTDACGGSCKLFQKSIMEGPAFFNVLEEVMKKRNEEDVKFFIGLSR